MRYILSLAYKGTHYAGWQKQPNALAVQSVLESKLAILLRQPIETLAAGRTDAGVHASELPVQFDYEGEIIPSFVYKLNKLLPSDISVKQLFLPQNSDFHARFDAISRTYHYFIIPPKNPYLTELAWEYGVPLDLGKMNACAELLKSKQDFACFAKAGGQQKTTICEIFSAKWENISIIPQLPYSLQPLLRFEVKANRFLRGMVRAMVGTMVGVGNGKLSMEDFEEILDKKNRSLALENAPPQGLFLTHVEYPTGTLIVKSL